MYAGNTESIFATSFYTTITVIFIQKVDYDMDSIDRKAGINDVRPYIKALIEDNLVSVIETDDYPEIKNKPFKGSSTMY